MNNREIMTVLTKELDIYEQAIRNHAIAEAAIKAANRELSLATEALERQDEIVGRQMDEVYKALTNGEDSQAEPKKSLDPSSSPYVTYDPPKTPDPTEADRLTAIREMERSSISEQENNRG